jgi:hypothetical protein
MTDDNLEDGEETTEEPAAAPRPPKRGPKRPPPLGAGAAPDFQRESSEADSVWNELTAWLPTQGLTPSSVMIQPRRITPPAPGGGTTPAGRFGGESVVASDTESPGTALIDYMIRYVQLPSMNLAATYELEFRHKSTGVIITKGRMNLPDRQGCLNMLSAEAMAQQPTQGMGAVPRAQQAWQQPPQAPQAPPPPQGRPWMEAPPHYAYSPSFGAPPAAAGMPPEAWGFMQSMMEQSFAAGREGRQMPMAAAQPAGVAQPPIDRGALVQEVTAGVLMALQKAGIGQPVAPPPAPVAPVAAAPTPASGLGAMVEGMTMRLMENIIKASGENMEKSIKQSMGMGAPPAAAEDDAEEVAAPEKPEDLLPWQAAPTGANWANGTPVVYAKPKPKEDGSDPTITDYIAGFAMNNPAALEKAMEIAQGVGNAVKDYLSRPGPGAAQVVRRIPAAAMDAGVGWLPPGAGEGGSSGGNAPPAPAAPAGGGWAP